MYATRARALLCRPPLPAPARRRMSTKNNKDYYEVLDLPRNCSDKDIKQAFIKISKQLHPDKNQASNTHDSFVRVVEAYNVLSKPGTRRQYDNMREISTSNYNPSSHYYGDAAGSYGRKYGERKIHEEFYHDAQTQNTRPSGSYYGVTGLKKLSNVTIVMICVVFVSVGIFMQMYIIVESFRIGRQSANEKSKKNGETLRQARENAKRNGNEVQTELMLKKIADSANPNIATATLGQALASDNPK